MEVQYHRPPMRQEKGIAEQPRVSTPSLEVFYLSFYSS
jgi:hypothetical protein